MLNRSLPCILHICYIYISYTYIYTCIYTTSAEFHSQVEDSYSLTHCVADPDSDLALKKIFGSGADPCKKNIWIWAELDLGPTCKFKHLKSTAYFCCT